MPPKSADAKKAVGGVRGVSAEEKSRRMLEIFKSAEVYSLKELEKLGAKKGVLSQVIPDVIKGLVNDGLVDMDKIGGGNFYWALPSKQGQRRKARLEALTKDLSATQDFLVKEKAKSTQLEAERQVSKERIANLKQHASLKEMDDELTSKLQHYADRDPTVLRALGERITFAMEEALRWGTNLNVLREYVMREMGMDAGTFDGRYTVGTQDFEQITWTNYNIFLPSESALAVRKVQDEDFPLDINREVEQTEHAETSSSASTPPTTAAAAVAAAMKVPIVNFGNVLARGNPQGREKPVAAAPFAQNKNDKAGKKEEEQAIVAKKKNKGKTCGVTSLKAVEPGADAAAPAAADKVADAPKAADAPSEAPKPKNKKKAAEPAANAPAPAAADKMADAPMAADAPSEPPKPKNKKKAAEPAANAPAPAAADKMADAPKTADAPSEPPKPKNKKKAAEPPADAAAPAAADKKVDAPKAADASAEASKDNLDKAAAANKTQDEDKPDAAKKEGKDKAENEEDDAAVVQKKQGDDNVDHKIQEDTAEDETEWKKEGSEYIGKKVRRYLFDDRNKPIDAADGVVVGWLSKEDSDFTAEMTGEPAPIWHIELDDVRVAPKGEDLEEHEIIEAINLMHLKMPAKMRAQYQKRLEFIATQANAGDKALGDKRNGAKKAATSGATGATGKRDRGTNSKVDDANDLFAFDDEDPEMNKKVKR